MRTPSRLSMVLTVITILLLASPAILYRLHFGGHLSAKHIRWSEFGAYIGGIYTPVIAILTLLTLLIISLQLSTQINHAFLANAKSDLHYYLEQIHSITRNNERVANAQLSHVLISMFGSKSHAELKNGVYINNVRRIGMTDDRVTALWGAIYTIFQGTGSKPEDEYSLFHSTSKQKCIAMLGYELCDALDNFHYVACNYPKDFKYEFHAGSRPNA